MKLLKASGAYYGEFTTQRFDTGAATDADPTPTATATKNGSDDGTFTLTVTKIDTGRYKITGTVPAGYTAGDVVQISVAATVNSVSGKAVVDEFGVVPALVYASLLAGTDNLQVDTTQIDGAAGASQAVRDSMKLAPSDGSPATGSVDKHLDDIVGVAPENMTITDENIVVQDV